MLFNLLLKKSNVKSSGAVLLAMLCATILSCARNNGTPTEIGTPIGDPVIATIDASGGTLASTDGLFEVIVPPGAVSSATDFEIQEITNNCFGGLGNGFAIKPADMMFNDNVTLVFHYGNVIDEFTDFSTLRMAIQDDRQIWMAFKDQQVDSVAKTISIKTNSFSPFAKTSSSQIRTADASLNRTISLLSSMRINPAESHVKLDERGKALHLEVNCPDCYDEYDPNDGEQLAPVSNWVNSPFRNTNWDTGGGPGEVEPYTRYAALYFAPEVLPANHSGRIIIWATTQVKMQKQTLIMRTNANIIIDADKFSFLLTIKVDPGRVPACVVREVYLDWADITFSIDNKTKTFKLEKVENAEQAAVDDFQSLFPECKTTVSDPGDLINVMPSPIDATVQKVNILGKAYTQIKLSAQGNTTEPTYFYDCGNEQYDKFYCPPDETLTLPVNYGITFLAEDESTYEQKGGIGAILEIIRLE